MLEQIAKEVGNSYTNRREITGWDRGPIDYREMSDEDIDRELMKLLSKIGLELKHVEPASSYRK